MSCVNWCNYSGTIPKKNDPESQLITWEIELSTFSNWFRNEILGIFEGETPVIPSTFYIAAHSTQCTAQTPGTELSGDGYARTLVTFERVSDIQRWNPAQVTSPTATANWDDVVAFSIWDSQEGGNYYAFGNLVEAVPVPTSNALTWQANQIIVGLGAAP